MPLPIILLENPKYPGNVGMICRLVSNFSLKPLRILGLPLEQDFEMKWMAHGAQEEIAKIEYYSDIWTCKQDLDLLIGTGMTHGRDRGNFLSFQELQTISIGKKYGIIFGREDLGLKKSTIEICDYMIDFQLPGMQKSMNLSNSVAFVLGKLYNAETKEEKEISRPINKNNFFQYAQKVFGLLGMNQFHGSENLAVKRFKSILEKQHLEQGDIDFLYKMFRNIEWASSSNGNANEE